jgi:hypothetical protein
VTSGVHHISSAHHLELLVDAVSDYAICMLDPNGFIGPRPSRPQAGSAGAAGDGLWRGCGRGGSRVRSYAQAIRSCGLESDSCTYDCRRKTTSTSARMTGQPNLVNSPSSELVSSAKMSAQLNSGSSSNSVNRVAMSGGHRGGSLSASRPLRFSFIDVLYSTTRPIRRLTHHYANSTRCRSSSETAEENALERSNLPRDAFV